MAHALSVSSYRSDHMAPSALGLAVLLHVLVGLALWWLALNRPQLPPSEDVIDITIEQPKPPEPPPPAPKQEAQPPPPPVELGLRPPAPIISDKPTQAPQAPQSKEPPAPAPPPEREAVPMPLAQPPPPSPTPQPQPTPPTPTPEPEPSPSPFQRTAPVEPAPPAPTPAPKQEQALVAPPPIRPPPAAPKPELAPSPLTMAPQRRPPASSSAEPPSPHPFVNPADVYSRARLTDNYLWQVARKLSGYRYQAHVTAREGLTVVRIVIARDGRLLDVAVIRSSGVPEFDRGVLAGVRAGSPYAPLPPEIQGDRASFDLPLVSMNRQ